MGKDKGSSAKDSLNDKTSKQSRIGMLYSLAFSDPSALEIIAIVIGILASVIGLFFILTKFAYSAGIYASPLTPYSGVRGYVAGFNNPLPIPSEAEIRENAINSFLQILIDSKLMVWLLFIVSFFITVYPIARRLQDTMLPATSISGKSLSAVVWTGLIPIVLLSLGYAFLFLTMTAAIYKFYFNSSIDRNFALVTCSYVLYMIATAVLFYDAIASTGRPDLGIVLGFLVGLGIDRLGLSVLGLVGVCSGIIVGGLAFLGLAIYKRWISL